MTEGRTNKLVKEWEQLSVGQRRQWFLNLPKNGHSQEEAVRKVSAQNFFAGLNKQDWPLIFNVKNKCYVQQIFMELEQGKKEELVKSMQYPELKTLLDVLDYRNTSITYNDVQREEVAIWYIKVYQIAILREHE